MGWIEKLEILETAVAEEGAKGDVEEKGREEVVGQWERAEGCGEREGFMNSRVAHGS